MFFINKELLRKLLDFKDEKDLADEFNDLDRIELAIDKVETGGSVIEAEQLAHEIYNKYPTIDKMLKVVSMLTRSSNASNDYISSDADRLPNNLKQDELGIYCHMILKKN